MYGNENQYSFVLQGWNSPGTIFQLRKMESWTYMIYYSCMSTSCFKSRFAFFFFQTLLIWSTFFHKAKIPQQKSCPEVEYCCVLNWPDLLRHFFFFANAQMHRVPHALFMQQVITTLNKRIFLYILPDLQLYTYMQKFLNLCDHIYTYTWNIHNKKD